MSGHDYINDFLLVIAAVLVFLSVEHFLTTNGYDSIAWVLIAVGALLLFQSDRLDRAIPTELINKKILNALAHIFIFIGLKIYLDPLLDGSWIVLLVIGLVLLNKSHVVAKLFKK